LINILSTSLRTALTDTLRQPNVIEESGLTTVDNSLEWQGTAQHQSLRLAPHTWACQASPGNN
jgi:hypothetical protein